MRTYLIVPAWSDQADQCRIVSREGRHPQALLSWREDHTLWVESGIMNSHGKLVCLDDPVLWEQMKADEPLCAGQVYYQEAPSQVEPSQVDAPSDRDLGAQDPWCREHRPRP